MNSKQKAIFKESLKEFFDDHMDHLAASVSFNLFFSLFPLALAAVFITQSVPDSQNIQDKVIVGINYLLPGFQQMIESVTNNAIAARNQIGVLVILGAIWGGISFFNAVRLSLNVAWGIHKPQSFLKTELVNFTLLIGAGIFVFVSVLLTAILNTEPAPSQPGIFQLIERNSAMLIVANILVASFAFLLFFLFYKFMPVVRPAWKDIWAGALVAAAFFEITKDVFILYLGVFNPLNLVDRSIATAIGFMMWTNISVLVFLFVAKTTHVNLKMRAVTEPEVIEPMKTAVWYSP